MRVEQAIREAELQLPGVPAADEGDDPRWQALITVGGFAESDPEPLWEFCRHWGSSEDEDLRAGVAACILEHLLQYHFVTIFPLVEAAVRSDHHFADCFSRCWEFGQTEEPENRRRFEALKVEVAAI